MFRTALWRPCAARACWFSRRVRLRLRSTPTPSWPPNGCLRNWKTRASWVIRACSKKAKGSDERATGNGRRESDCGGAGGRRRAVRYFELSNRVRGAGASDHAPTAGYSGAFFGYRLSFCRNLRVPRSNGRTAAFESSEPGGQAERGPAGGAVRNPQPDRAGPLLPSAKGGTAVCRSGELRRLVHGAAAGSVADACESEGAGWFPAARREKAFESKSAGGLDNQGRVAISQRAGTATTLVVRAGLLEHRLRTVHFVAG